MKQMDLAVENAGSIASESAEKQRELLAWPHSLELFAHLREPPGPLRCTRRTSPATPKRSA